MSPHIHLLINHVPLIGAVFAALLLGFAAVRRSDELARAGLGAFVLLGAAAVIVYLSGEGAEEGIEHLPWASEPLIERHEEMAMLATSAFAIFGSLALVALIATRRRVPRWLPLAAVAGSLVPVTLVGTTAYFGGQIRHDEIRSGAPAAAEFLIPDSEGAHPYEPEASPSWRTHGEVGR